MQGVLYNKIMNIFKWVKNLFSEKIITSNLSEKIQGGLIVERPRPSDWFASAVVEGEKVLWGKYLPKGENQNVKFVFDTMSCTTFSALNIIETLFRKMELPPEHKLFLEKNGYYKDGEVNFSDKFTAIVSGTRKSGNTFQEVGNSIRHNGLIPDVILPFGGETKWEDWHNPIQIKPYMINLGLEFARYFDISYSFVYFSEDGVITPEYKKLIESNLTQSPLQIAIPYPGTHATMLYDLNEFGYLIFDTYDPYVFTKDIKSKIHYVSKFTVTPKKVTTEQRTLKIGSIGKDVEKMQSSLKFLMDDKIVVDGVFGKGTESALKKFQIYQGISPDGIFGKITRSKLYSYDMEQPIAMITRDKSVTKQTQGFMKAYKNGVTMYCKTLELPWLENKKNVSCIPKGQYEVEWTYSPSFKKYTYEIKNVKGRTGIRFHSGSYKFDFKGCIGLGADFKQLNKDGLLDLVESRDTVKKFEEFFGKEKFTLIIQ